ncbi:MAG: hypothetical protein PHQ36_03565 [Anaerolineales bacterium]|nr:hypothetical protein [Anaerolineales bacterium]
MKKILLPILAFILFACSPNAPALQVTVIPKMTVTLPVTQTSTPTSTAVIWQDADGKWYRGSMVGEKGAVLNENNTWSVIVAPGLYQNGSEFTLQLADGTEVVLGDKDVVFDEDGKWQSVNGYTQDEDGKWAPVADIAKTETGIEATKLFDQIGIDPKTYNLKMNGEVIVAVDKETGKEVFRDGKFDLRYAVENAKDLMPTKYKPKDENYIGVPNIPPDIMNLEYFIPLFKRAREEFKKSTGSDIYIKNKTRGSYFMLNPDILAYGIKCDMNIDDPNAPVYLIYEKKDSEIVFVPLKPVSSLEVLYFWVNAKK